MRGDDGPCYGREGQEPGETSQEEDEGCLPCNIEQLGSPGDTASELEGNGKTHDDNTEVEGNLVI